MNWSRYIFTFAERFWKARVLARHCFDLGEFLDARHGDCEVIFVFSISEVCGEVVVG
jgi:hypothetical protein